MCNIQRTQAFELTKLPSELICRVMFHTPVDDLKNLVEAGGELKDQFEANRRYIFKGVQRVQYSDFEGLFGELPAFESTNVKCVRDSAGFAASTASEGSDNGAKPTDPFSSACYYTRTINQEQNLKDAISSAEWGENEVDLESPPLPSEKVFKILCQEGGWDYLRLLSYLQESSDLLLGDMKLLGFRMNSMEQPQLRAAMLTIQRMHWRRNQARREMDPASPRFFDSVAMILKAQPLEVQKTVHRILHFLTTKLTATHFLDRQASAFKHKYSKARLEESTTMMSDTSVQRFLQETITGLAFWTCFYTGIDRLMGGLFEKADRKATHSQQNFVTIKMKTILKRRLRADFQGTSTELGGYISVEQGLYLVRAIDYEIRPFGGF